MRIYSENFFCCQMAAMGPRDCVAARMEEGRAQASESPVEENIDLIFASLQVPEGRRGAPEVVLREGPEHPLTTTALAFADFHQVYQSARDIAVERPRAIECTRPVNFGFVLPGIYRSSYPQTQDYPFLQSLKLKTIITLVQKDLPEGFQTFMDDNGIRHQVFDMDGTKKTEIPLHMMRSILELSMDRRNHPLLIHCNHGKHRTGCVVGVMRRFNGWDTNSIVAEYNKFAEPKAREMDVKYLSEFKLTNLRHLVARKMEEPPMTVGQFMVLAVVSALCLALWLFTANHFNIPQLSRPARRSLARSTSNQA